MITTPFTAKSTAAEVLAGVDLTGKRALVTGGASGIGASTAHALAAAGAQVTVGTRNVLDLADLDSVRAFAEGWQGPLDILVANAGIMALPTRQVSEQGWELQLATNFLGHFALITGLRASLAEGARVVVVSSGAQLGAGVDFDDPQFERRPYDPWVAYSQSKTADVLLAVGISQRWTADGIVANAVAPGYIHTKLQRHIDDVTMRAMGAMDDSGALVTPEYYKTPDQGAATSVLLAASPLVDGVTGRYFEDCQELPVVPGGSKGGVADWAVDPVAAGKLWELATAAL